MIHFKNQNRLSTDCGTEVVISGISGTFLTSKNIEEFAKNLQKGNSVDKWSMKYNSDHQKSEKIDFGRTLTACCYNATFDSGVNPSSLSSTKTGIFLATCQQNSSQIFDESDMCLTSKHRYANQIATVLNLGGPIKVLEDKVCSTLVLIRKAQISIEEGECEQALVCGMDTYDSDSITIGCLFLQKKNVCKRCYAKPVSLKILKPLQLSNQEPIVFETYNYQTVMSGIEAVLKTLVGIQRGRLFGSSEYCGDWMAVKVVKDSSEYACLILKPVKMTEPTFWTQSKNLSHLPRLFTCTAPTQESNEYLIAKAENNSTDLSVHCLLENALSPPLSSLTVKPNLFRAFTVLNSTCHHQTASPTTNPKPPIYLIFSDVAIDSQCTNKYLMHLPAFKESINKSHEVLSSGGYGHLLDLIQAELTTHTFSSTTNSFVLITATQIALVDCLTSLGIQAQGLIGISIGELACAYADQALSHQEAIMCAYQSGLTIDQANLPASSVAKVNLGWESVLKKCPEGVHAYCNAHCESVLVSGKKEAVNGLVDKLKKDGFVAEVVSDVAAIHSHFITIIAGKLKAAMEKVIEKPTGKRSCRWLSTSMPESHWQTDLAMTASAGYMVNNLCGHVLLKEALELVPKKAICIQIGASNFLEETLSKCLPEATRLTLTRVCEKEQSDTERLTHFWEQLGQVFLSGYDLKPCNLFITKSLKNNVFPVPVDTAFLSDVAKFTYFEQGSKLQKRHSIQDTLANSKQFVIDVDDPESRFLLGHMINGECVLPVGAFIYMVWKTFSSDWTPIQFVNVTFCEKVQLRGGVKIILVVNLDRQSGMFQVVLVDNDLTVCEGQIQHWKHKQLENEFLDQILDVQSVGVNEIYQKLEEKGHSLKDEFRSIVSMNKAFTSGQIEWTYGNWISLLDGMMQTNFLNLKGCNLEPLSIKSIRIDPSQINHQHQHMRTRLDDSFEVLSLEQNPVNKQLLRVYFDPKSSSVRCEGVEICCIVCSSTSKTDQIPCLLQFTAYMKDSENPSVDKRLMNEVTNYLAECKDLSMQIISRIDKNEQQAKICNKSKQNHGKLLDLLTEAACIKVPKDCAYADQVNKLFMVDCSLFRAIQEDQLINSLPYERDFRALIDIVIENIGKIEVPTRPVLRVLEISSSVNKFYGLKLSQIMQENHPEFLVDYKFASMLSTDNQTEINRYLNKKTTKMFEVEFLEEWCIMKENFLNMNLPEGLKKFDLIVFNTCLSAIGSSFVSKREMKDWISICAGKLMKPRGFFIVHEFTRNLENVRVISELEQKIKPKLLSSKNKTCSKNIYGFCNENEWRNTLEEIDFIPISIKSDNCLSSLMLYRQPFVVQQTGPHTIKSLISTSFLSIDESNWTKTCNDILQSPQIKRIFLVSLHKPNLQVLRQIFSLKKVNPNSWKIRCIFTCDSVHVSMDFFLATLEEKKKMALVNKSQIDENLLMIQVLKTDLFMNVFSGGEWGSLRMDRDGEPVEKKQFSHRKTTTKYLMPQKCIENMNNLAEEAFSQAATSVVMIHPIEGHINMLKSLSKLLKFPVYGVQYTEEAMQCGSIKSLAEFYWSKLQSVIKNRKVHLCGLGFGGLVALEMALMNQPKCVSLTILDPCQQLVKIPGSFNINKSEADVLTKFAEKYLPHENHETEQYEMLNKLVKLNSLQKRVDFLVDELMNKSKFQLNAKDLNEAAFAFVKKSQMIEEYSPDLNCKLGLKCQIVKATSDHSDLEDLIKGYCKSTERMVINCDQRSMLEGDKCVEIGQIMNRKFIESMCQ